jgi:hypothetical protein
VHGRSIVGTSSGADTAAVALAICAPLRDAGEAPARERRVVLTRADDIPSQQDDLVADG